MVSLIFFLPFKIPTNIIAHQELQLVLLVLFEVDVLTDKSVDLFSILPVLFIVTTLRERLISAPEAIPYSLLLQSFFLLLAVLYQRLFERREGDQYSIFKNHISDLKILLLKSHQKQNYKYIYPRTNCKIHFL